MADRTLPEYIKLHTKTEHAALEKQLIGIIKNIHTTEQYIHLLRMFHGYYHALELQMEQYLKKDLIPDIAERRKSNALLQDIRDLGGDSKNQQGKVDTPDINSYAQALGAAYVLEGSTLGGVIIAKMIRAQLPDIPAGKGFSFFNCYGENAHGMWNKFRTYLLALTRKEDQEAAADTARQTFLKFKAWIDQYEPVF
ncbi:biliverdin-producing heme oxygenase [Longitalea luteola]|uniref:biliverdin-producing heme oxygenase n=1 Tax=Longitalea luteola TaxID=2812563 RepID=UPI001A96A7B4